MQLGKVSHVEFKQNLWVGHIETSFIIAYKHELRISKGENRNLSTTFNGSFTYQIWIRSWDKWKGPFMALCKYG
jgi:hypothetical protein